MRKPFLILKNIFFISLSTSVLLFFFNNNFLRSQEEIGDEKKTITKLDTEEDESTAEPKSKRIKVEEEVHEVKEGIVTCTEDTIVIKAEIKMVSQDETKAITKKKNQPIMFKDEINEEALNLSLQVMSK